MWLIKWNGASQDKKLVFFTGACYDNFENGLQMLLAWLILNFSVL